MDDFNEKDYQAYQRYLDDVHRKAAMLEGKEIDINTPPKRPSLRDVTSYQNSGYISKWVVDVWFCSMLLLIIYLFYTIIMKYF